MAHNFSLRARKLAWSFSDEKQVNSFGGIRRVGTDSTLNDDDEGANTSTSVLRISATDDVRKFKSALKQDGCVIIENFADLQTIHKANEEGKKWMKACDSQNLGDIVPLIKQSPTIRNNLYTNRVYQELCDELLTVQTTRWRNDCLNTEQCSPILSLVVTRRVQATGSESKISRHDLAFGTNHESTSKYQLGRDSTLGLIVPGSQSIRVHAVLGSHLHGSETPDFDNLVEVELEVGDALIVLGSLYHYVCAEPERQANAEPALVHAMWSCSGVYRPEEQSATKISTAELRTYPTIVQERLR